MNYINESPLKSVLLGEDDVGKIIHTHIYIEEIINSYIYKSVSSPSHLKKLNLDYFGSVNLAISLGFPEDLQKPLNAIGKIRNDFSHKLNQKIDENRVNNFFETFSPKQKNEIMQSLKGTSWSSWGKTSNEQKFIVLCISLYWMCKIAIVELEHEMNITKQSRILAEISIKK